VAVHEPVLPDASLTVITTGLMPLLAQVKVVFASEINKLPDGVQLSDDPLFMWATVSDAVPTLFRNRE